MLRGFKLLHPGYIPNIIRKVETRTYKDRRIELIKAVAKRRRKIKTLAIAYKGGRCQICGYHRCPGALELHHTFGEKEFGISDKGYTRSWTKVQMELDKFVLLCANCHREVGAGFVKLDDKVFLGKLRYSSGHIFKPSL